jgi:general secretion pathway protein J
MQSASPERAAGFTLVEMLIAITIFGVIAVAGYRALDGVLTTRERVGDEYRRWREVARALAWMEQDFEAVQARPIRGAANEVLPPMLGVAAPAATDQPVVTLTRNGGYDAAGLAVPPRRIGYRLTNGVLERLVWPALDAAAPSRPAVTVLLRGVSALALRYRDAGGRWRQQWPVPAALNQPGGASSHVAESGAIDTTLPTGVDITIGLAGGERIQRLVPLPAGTRS